MAADAVLFCYNKKFANAGQCYFCMVSKKRGDLKMIHDENDVSTDDELVVARNFLKKSKHACLYMENEFPRGFKLLNHI